MNMFTQFHSNHESVPCTFVSLLPSEDAYDFQGHHVPVDFVVSDFSFDGTAQLSDSSASSPQETFFSLETANPTEIPKLEVLSPDSSGSSSPVSAATPSAATPPATTQINVKSEPLNKPKRGKTNTKTNKKSHEQLASAGVKPVSARRKVRRAELARACRLRKKRFIENLEAKVQALEQQLLARGEVPVTKETATALQEKLQNVIAPSQAEQLALWGLSQNDEFYTHAPGLWTDVMHNMIGINQKQEHQLMDLRPDVRQVWSAYLGINQQVNTLFNSIASFQQQQKEVVEKLHKCLSPTQFEDFLTWTQQAGNFIPQQ